MIKPGQLVRSFRHAFSGIGIVFRTEQSFRIQVIIAVFVLLAATFLGVSVLELVALLAMIAFVLVLELINSTLERLVDTFKPRMHPMVGEIKDIMAAAVLVGSLVAAAVGIVVLGPPVLLLLGVG